MGKPYADDLRGVAVRLIGEGHTRVEVAELCGISLSTVGRYVRRYRTTGSVRPAKFGGYKGYSLAKHADRIGRWLAKQPDLTLLEIQARLAEAKVKVAASSVFRFLRHLGLTFKKRARIGGPPVAVETDRAIVEWRGAAESFLVDLSP
jgi:transposase